jgi:hypothetical protein
VRKFCGERFTIYLVPVLAVLIYSPRTVEHTSMAKGLVINGSYLHREGRPPGEGVRTHLKRNMLSGIIS